MPVFKHVGAVKQEHTSLRGAQSGSDRTGSIVKDSLLTFFIDDNKLLRQNE